MRLSKSSITQAEVDSVVAALNEGYLGMGPQVGAFENELREFLGGDREVVCVNSGSAALHLAVQGCGIGPGDEVLVPTLTFVACFQAVTATGATPVPCDVRASDCFLDMDDARRRMTERTKAIMPVHYASARGDMANVYRLAEDHGLRVIEDAAHAFGCRHNNHRVGATGDIVCFSFDSIKNITCGEGGALVTGDAELADQVRDARLLGVHKDSERRIAGQRSWSFEVKEQGWRYHMSDLMAAVGRAQLRRFDELAARRIALALRYDARLKEVPHLRTLATEYGQVVPHIYPVAVDAERADGVRAALAERGIESGRHYMPNHLHEKFGGGVPALPVAEKLYRELITLPLHPAITDADIDEVCVALAAALGN